MSNPRLEEMAEDLLDEATGRYQTEGHKARLFSEGLYGAASWEHSRRVIYKAEAMEQGTNTCFLVTTRTDQPRDLYTFYARRGHSEGLPLLPALAGAPRDAGGRQQQARGEPLGGGDSRSRPLRRLVQAFTAPVQEMLGHANISMTMDTYSHVLPDMQEKAVTAMDDALS